MKIPKSQRLLAWYHKMLDSGIAKGCIASYTDIHRQALVDDVKVITQFPYFDSEFWPNQFEEAIDKVIRSETESLSQSSRNVYERPRYQSRTRSSQSSQSSQTLAICGSSQTNTSYSRRSSGRVTGNNTVKPIHVQINENIMNQLETHKSVFFVVTLIQPDDCTLVDQAGAKQPNRQTTGSSSSQASSQERSKDDGIMISDPDFEINCRMFDARETFLMFCRSHFLEFSNLRLAKYSTARLVEIVVRDHCEDLLNLWNVIKHVHKCVKSLKEKPRGYKCKDEKCTKMRNRLNNKNTNDIYNWMYSQHLGTNATFENLFPLIAKAVILRHNAYCFDPKSCPENVCKYMEKRGDRPGLLAQCRDQ